MRAYAEARAYVRGLGIATAADYFVWAATSTRPRDIPSNPDKAYALTGWLHWRDYLGDTPRRVVVPAPPPAGRGTLLRQARMARGLTIPEVARRAGVGEHTIVRLEQNHPSRAATYARVAAVLAAVTGDDAPDVTGVTDERTTPDPYARIHADSVVVADARTRRLALGISRNAVQRASGLDKDTTRRAEQGYPVRPATATALSAALTRLEDEARARQEFSASARALTQRRLDYWVPRTRVAVAVGISDAQARRVEVGLLPELYAPYAAALARVIALHQTMCSETALDTTGQPQVAHGL